MTTLPVPQVEREKKIRGWPGSIHQSLDQERKGDRYRFPFRKGKEKSHTGRLHRHKRETLNPKLKCGVQDMCGNKGFLEPCFIAVRQGGFFFATDHVMHRPITRNPQPFATLYFPYFLCRKAPDAKYPIRIKKLCTLPCVCMYRSDKREKSFLLFPRVQFGIFDQIISFRLSLPLLDPGFP